jgi:hypothetical protein
LVTSRSWWLGFREDDVEVEEDAVVRFHGSGGFEGVHGVGGGR